MSKARDARRAAAYENDPQRLQRQADVYFAFGQRQRHQITKLARTVTDGARANKRNSRLTMATWTHDAVVQHLIGLEPNFTTNAV